MARITRRLHDRVQRHREAIYTWTFVIFSTPCVFVPYSMDERFFRTSRCPISPVAREESAIKKMGEEKGVESWNSTLRIVTIVHRWKDDRDGISFASPSSAKVSSIFVQRSGTLFAKSPRNVLLSSCQFEMWHHSYFDLLRRFFGDESVKIVSSGTRG